MVTSYQIRKYIMTERTEAAKPYRDIDNPYTTQLPPPPPPEWYMHQRTGKAWKMLIPIVMFLLGGVSGVLAYPVINAMYYHGNTVVASPTPFIPFVLPTPTATIPATSVPSYVNDLSASDFPTFLIAFTQAMNRKDFDSVTHSTDTTNFQMICYS